MSDDYKAEMEGALLLRARAKALEDESKVLKAQSSVTLGTLMALHDIPKFGIQGVGQVSQKISRGSSVNVKKLTENLVLEGMEPDDIARVVKASSTTWSTQVIEFRLKFKGE